MLESFRPILRDGFHREGGGFVSAGHPHLFISDDLARQLVAGGVAELVGDRLLLKGQAVPVAAPAAEAKEAPDVPAAPGPEQNSGAHRGDDASGNLRGGGQETPAADQPRTE